MTSSASYIAMSSGNKLCHLKCELNMLGARYLDAEHHSAAMFLRCYVSTGGGGRYVRVDTGEIPIPMQASCSPAIPQLAPLAVIECQGDADDMSKLLEEQSIVIELRQRKAASLLGRRFSRSKLLGKSSVAWKETMVSAAGGERWIAVDGDRCRRPAGDQKPPAVLVEMKTWLTEIKPAEMARRRVAACTTDVQLQCRCRYCEWNLEEEDMFALATTIPAC